MPEGAPVPSVYRQLWWARLRLPNGPSLQEDSMFQRPPEYVIAL